MSPFQIEDFGLAPYEAIWERQQERVKQRLADEIPDTLLIGEHEPVITTGRGTQAENLLNPTLPVVAIERGGDVTYHGPGQLIAYPILYLPPGRRDLHAYLRQLEEAIILTLAEFGLQGCRNPGWTGVWVPDETGTPFKKIASIGVAVRKWVTYHGIALNVSTDLSPYRQINPCGLESDVMTAMDKLLPSSIPMEKVKEIFAQSLNRCIPGRKPGNFKM